MTIEQILEVPKRHQKNLETIDDVLDAITLELTNDKLIVDIRRKGYNVVISIVINDEPVFVRTVNLIDFLRKGKVVDRDYFMGDILDYITKSYVDFPINWKQN